MAGHWARGRASALAGVLVGLWMVAGWAAPLAAAGTHAVGHVLHQGVNYGRPKVS